MEDVQSYRSIQEFDYEIISSLDWITNHFSCTNEFSSFNDELITILSESGCILKGHFQLLSGKHSEYFLQLSKITRQAKFYRPITKQLSNALIKRNIEFNAILSPDTAGSFLSYGIQQEFEEKQLPMYISRTDEKRQPTTETNFIDVGQDSQVVIVNDMITTEKGLENLLEICSIKKLVVKGVVLFANGGSENLDIPSIINSRIRNPIHIIQMCDITLPKNATWVNKDECLLCNSNVPLIKSEQLN
jgi:orotate phosphoribosyltransferase